jgi:DNA-binding GntR family transcriptional regulator
LQEMVLDLRLAPGAFANAQSLASDLGLGRMPVREALARLAKDRFITIVPRRGIIVTPLTLDDVLDMFEAREAIECGVAYIAATRATDDDLRTMRELIETVDRSRMMADTEQFLKDDHAVHTFLVHMIRNPQLQDAADQLLLHTLRFWRLYWKNLPPKTEAMLSHAELLAALEDHDPAKAAQAMRNHLQTSRQFVQLPFWRSLKAKRGRHFWGGMRVVCGCPGPVKCWCDSRLVSRTAPSQGRGHVSGRPWPPSATTTVPVTNEADSWARKSTHAATSSGVPLRPIGPADAAAASNGNCEFVEM